MIYLSTSQTPHLPASLPPPTAADASPRSGGSGTGALPSPRRSLSVFVRAPRRRYIFAANLGLLPALDLERFLSPSADCCGALLVAAS